MEIHRTVYDCATIRFPRFNDDRGNLSFVEQSRHVPFRVKRAYWVYDVPGGERRGEHAFSKAEECVIALSGSFDVLLDDGIAQKVVTLTRAYMGLYIPNMIWRQFQNFSTNAVAFVLSSTEYSDEDYIRNYQDYRTLRENLS